MIGKFKDVRSKKLKREGFVTKPIFICGPHTCHIYRWITNPSLYSEPSKTLTNSAVLVCCTMYFGRRLLKFDLYAYYENKHISSHHIGLELTLQSSQMLVGQMSVWIKGLYIQLYNYQWKERKSLEMEHLSELVKIIAVVIYDERRTNIGVEFRVQVIRSLYPFSSSKQCFPPTFHALLS